MIHTIEAPAHLFPRDVSFSIRRGDDVMDITVCQVGEAFDVEELSLRRVRKYYQGHHPELPGAELVISGKTGRPETLIVELS